VRDLTLFFAVVLSGTLTYVLTGDVYFAGSLLLMGFLVYTMTIKPPLGMILFYGLLGFLGGFLVALLLGLTVFRHSEVGSYLLLSLLIIGPLVAIFMGRKTNYRLWFLLKP